MLPCSYCGRLWLSWLCSVYIVNGCIEYGLFKTYCVHFWVWLHVYWLTVGIYRCRDFCIGVVSDSVIGLLIFLTCVSHTAHVIFYTSVCIETRNNVLDFWDDLGLWCFLILLFINRPMWHSAILILQPRYTVHARCEHYNIDDFHTGMAAGVASALTISGF